MNELKGKYQEVIDETKQQRVYKVLYVYVVSWSMY